ncbi:MAG TPA: peptidoglycan bridge formation glycyltransferase FemA/FemB family protein [Firmicutes bacterium]|nr:peptidoglycan bridge formation glycyltransferase FemA/FemB family protein [Bacillota bacterium]
MMPSMHRIKDQARFLTFEEYQVKEKEISHHFLQSSLWGCFKARHGWEPCYMGVFDQKKCVGLALALLRKLPRNFLFAYIPKGPAFSETEEAFLQKSLAIRAALKNKYGRRLLFVRMEPHKTAPELPKHMLKKKGWKKAPYDIQYRYTRLIPLSTEEAFWQGLTSKQRNKIKTASRKGVRIYSLSDKDAVAEWYKVYTETACRNAIFIHPLAYYEDFFNTFQSSGTLSFWAAFYEEEMLAGAFIIHYREESLYMYSGSSDKERQRRPNEAIQWAAVREAVSRGSFLYDMWGVAPPEEEHHPWAGLSRFKAGFGGEVAEFAGCWDYPCRPLFYRAFIAAEKIRRILLAFRRKGQRRP